MKKIVLSLGVVVVYIAYSLMSRQQTSGLKLEPNTSASQTTANATGQSSSGTSTSSGGSVGSGAGPTAPSSATTYKDGTFTGSEADAFYGLVKVAVTISGGKITAVTFLEHPGGDPNTNNINSQAMPYLQQEAIQAQSAHIDGVSGATDTSQAFIQSLSAALQQAAS